VIPDGLLNGDDLKEWTEIKQDKALRRWLDAEPHPIPYKVSPKGVICTTLAAVTDALTKRENDETWAA